MPTRLSRPLSGRSTRPPGVQRKAPALARRGWTSAWLACLLVLAVACGSPTASTGQAVGPSDQPRHPAPRGVDQREWDALIVAAQAEGKLTAALQGDRGERNRPLLDIFSKEFGIAYTNPPGRSMEVADRILAEQAAGRYTFDIFNSGLGRMNIIADLGRFVPIEDVLFPTHEILNPAAYPDGHIWWQDPTQKYVLLGGVTVAVSTARAINTNLVQPGELKTEFDELNPKWRGRIVISDPRRLAEQGGQQFFYSQTAQGRELWPRLLTENRPAVIEDARLHLDSVARGTYAIGGLGIATVRQEVSTMKKLGLPIDTVELARPPEWAADAASGVGVFINAPHPNVVKLFVNWWYSEEGWKAWVQTLRDNPEQGGNDMVPLYRGRSTDHLEAWIPPLPSEGLQITDVDPAIMAKLDDGKKLMRSALETAGY